MNDPRLPSKDLRLADPPDPRQLEYVLWMRKRAELEAAKEHALAEVVSINDAAINARVEALKRGEYVPLKQGWPERAYQPFYPSVGATMAFSGTYPHWHSYR